MRLDKLLEYLLYFILGLISHLLISDVFRTLKLSDEFAMLMAIIFITVVVIVINALDPDDEHNKED